MYPGAWGGESTPRPYGKTARRPPCAGVRGAPLEISRCLGGGVDANSHERFMYPQTHKHTRNDT